MNKPNNFRPTNQEIENVARTARRDARRGTLAGGLSGAIVGGWSKRKPRLGRVAGALVGAGVGNVIGRKVGRDAGARDVVTSRKALLRENSMGEIQARLVQLEQLSDDHAYTRAVTNARRIIASSHGLKYANALTDDQALALVENDHPGTGNPDLLGCFEADDERLDLDYQPAGQRDANGNFNESATVRLSPRRLLIAQKYGLAIAQSLAEDELDDQHAAAMAKLIMGKSARGNTAGAGSADELTYARRFFASKVGHAAVAAMSDAEVRAHYLGAQRSGLVELDDQADTDFLDTRMRSGSGEFLPGGQMDPNGARRAYSKDRTTGKSVGAAGALGAAAGLAGALVIHRKLKRAKLPKLTTSGKVIDVNAAPVKFERRNMPVIKAAGMPQRIIRRPRRNGTLLAKLRSFGAGSLVGSLAGDALEAIGLGGATAPKKKQKIYVDRAGNPINVASLDPGTTSASSFSAIGKLAPYAAEGAVIGGADLVAERANSALERRRAREQRRKAKMKGGIEATPGLSGAPQTMSAMIATTLNDFDSDGARERARRRAAVLGATGAGAAAGAVAGLKHDQGTPVSHSDLKPGDRVYRRFGPAGLFQHHGVVGEDGRVTHRTSGSPSYRSIKPDSFRKTGNAPTFRESDSSNLPRRRAAKNASAAAGTRAGKYSLVGENCQHGASRLVSRGKPVSGQLRRAAGGAAIGAVGAGAIAALIARRKKENQ